MRTRVYNLKESHLNAIRDCIIDNNILEGDTILLNRTDFRNIVLAYKDRFGIGITYPYSILGVLLEEDKLDELSPGEINVLQEGETKLAAERRNTLFASRNRTIQKQSSKSKF
jgi:hypothetical protein